MCAGLRRQPFLVGAPAQLGRLQAFGDEPVDRPGVDECADGLGLAAALGVTFGDVDPSDAGLAHKFGPLRASGGADVAEPDSVRDVEQGLLDEPRDHARVRPAGRDRRRPAGAAAAFGKQALPQSVVRALREWCRRVVVEARPGFYDGVEIERAEFPGQCHDRDRRRVDGEVDAECPASSGGKQWGQDGTVVVRGEQRGELVHAVGGEDRGVGVVGRDDGDLFRLHVEMPEDQRQGSPADRTEPDHDDRAGQSSVVGIVAHDVSSDRPWQAGSSSSAAGSR